MKVFRLIILTAVFSQVAWSGSSLEDVVRTRQEWGARVARGDMIPDDSKTIFAVHHTAGSFASTDHNAQSVQNLHMDKRGWADVGYHFLVGGDGQVYEGRALRFAGAHVYGHNMGSIGISCLGCFDTVECHLPRYHEVQSPTDAMIHSVGHLIGILSQRYNTSISHDTVKGHREFSGTKTACPGDLILARMNEVRAIAQTSRNDLEATTIEKEEL